jgi:hypothetical protein
MAIIKLIIPTVIFYAAAFAIITILNKISPGGPCTPGLAFFGFMFSIPVIIGLLIYNIYLAIKKDNLYGIIAMVHAIVLVVIFSFF